MESDELFENWAIRNVTGTIYVEEKQIVRKGILSLKTMFVSISFLITQI